MKRMLALVSDEQKLQAFQSMTQTPIFQEWIKGVREALPCAIPPPEKCTEGYLGALAGKQTTRDLILDVMTDPDHWIQLAKLVAEATPDQYADITKHLEEDSVFYKDQRLTPQKIREELENP